MGRARNLANVISGAGTISVDAIPALPTSKITSGTFDNARLSSGSVTQHVDLSNLNASNLTSGTVPSARVSLSASDIPNLSANKITSDALGADRIPALSSDKITSGTLGADRIPALPTSKVTSGTFADARLSSSSVTQHVDLTALSASNLTSGTIPNDRYGTPTFSAANLTSLPSPSPESLSAVGSYGLGKAHNYSGGTARDGGLTTSDFRYNNVNNNSSDSDTSGTWRAHGSITANSDLSRTTVFQRIA
ncbi:hypothetical protein OAP76_00775 [Alphaproteobacteria bacterium]|nr:hypothetical protein [Alphaproteobacteria bacterium]